MFCERQTDRESVREKEKKRKDGEPHKPIYIDINGCKYVVDRQCYRKREREGEREIKKKRERKRQRQRQRGRRREIRKNTKRQINTLTDRVRGQVALSSKLMVTKIHLDIVENPVMDL